MPTGPDPVQALLGHQPTIFAFAVHCWTDLADYLASVVQAIADLHERLHYTAVDIRPELMFAAVDEDGHPGSA